MTLQQSVATLKYGLWYYAEYKGVNVPHLNILICNHDMFSPCRGLLLPTGSPDLRALRITAADKWIPTHDSVMRAHAAAALNYYILVHAFAQGLPSLQWFRGVASICKQAWRLQAAGPAPWVQCYLLSQLKRGSPQAGTSGSWAHAWLLTPTCLLMVARCCTQHREVTVFSGTAAYSPAGF